MKSDPWLDWPSVGAVSDFKQTSFVAHKKRLLLLALHITSSSDRYHGLASNLHLSQRGLSSEIPLRDASHLSLSFSLCPFYPVLAPARGNPSRATHHLFARLQKLGRRLRILYLGRAAAAAAAGHHHTSLLQLYFTVAHMRIYFSTLSTTLVLGPFMNW